MLGVIMIDTDPARLKISHRSRRSGLKIGLRNISASWDAPCVTPAFDNAIIHTTFCINL
jgi:hypothetical protein